MDPETRMYYSTMRGPRPSPRPRNPHFFDAHSCIRRFIALYYERSPPKRAHSDRKGDCFVDIQKIIEEVVSKLKLDPKLLAAFAADPVKTLEKTFNIDLPDDQINAIINGVKSKIDLSKVDVGQAVGILGKLKGLFGK